MRLVALSVIPTSFGEIEPGQRFTAEDVLGQKMIDAGKCKRLPDPDVEHFDKMRGRWKDSTIVIIASGPSLDEADCEYVRDWRTLTGGNVIALNTTYRELAPWADILYAGDWPWWRHNGASSVAAEAWTVSEKAHLEFGPRYAPNLFGMSTGHQAISLAVHFGAARVVLLGYDVSADNGRQQWHAPHPNAPQSQPYADWLLQFSLQAEDLKAQGVSVVNCTRRTALKCFPRVALQDELASAVLAP